VNHAFDRGYDAIPSLLIDGPNVDAELCFIGNDVLGVPDLQTTNRDDCDIT